jgi:tripartite-type tricarboxylate transporter receptor subunit TctC
MTKDLGKLSRRQIVTSIAGAAALPFCAWAQTTYPVRPIRLMVGFPPGTGPDILARLLTPRMTEQLRQPLVVENRPGAGGQIAALSASKSAADGYTLLLGEAGAISIAPSAFPQLPYEPAKDFVGVAELAWADFVLVVPAHSPHRSLAALIQTHKARPDPLLLGTFGPGSPGHFGASEFGAQAGLKVEPVHFRSTGDAISALVSGQISGAWVSTAIAQAQVKGGTLRALAIAAPRPSPLLPDVPTTAEAGLAKLRLSSWLGVLAPAGTPAALVERLNKLLVESVQSDGVRQRLTETGFNVSGTSATETDLMLKTEARHWADIVRTSGFKGST